MKKSVLPSLSLTIASVLVGAAPSVHAHSYYNLTGAGSVASGDSAIGFGIANSINGADGVSLNSNGTNRVADGTNTYNASTNNLISGTGSAAASATEIPGNLPYMWYSGQHTYATGVTKRDLFTGSSVSDNTANMLSGMSGTAASNTSLTLPNGLVLNAPGTTNWGTNNTASLWNAYNAKNTGANAATWGTIMADLPGGTTDAEHPFLAVAGNSTSTGLGMDYGLIHISCGANSAGDNCASQGDILATITLKNDSDYSQYNGLLDVALYRGSDINSTSSRTAAYSLGDTNPQGSSLGAPIWTASMSSTSDTLFHSFIFNQSEWDATGATGFHTNGFYTLIVSAHGGLATDGVAYDVLVTTSPVPVPAAVWLFGSALAGLGVFTRREKKALA